jgi:uncharacterized RDD family membrane protein YckC
MIVSSLFYILILTGNSFAVFSFFLLLTNGYKQIKGSIMTTIFFPYKLVMSIIVGTKVFHTTYFYKKKEYTMDIKI